MKLLIQKGRFLDVKNEQIEGMDTLVKLHAMLYAEYEDGSIFRSLQRMAKDVDNLECFEITFKKCTNRPVTKKIMVVANLKENNRRENIEKEIRDIGNEKAYTKGYSSFPSYLRNESNKEERPFSYFDFWWNLTEDYMFFDASDKNYEQLMLALRKLNEKWFPKPDTFLDKIKKFFRKEKKYA